MKNPMMPLKNLGQLLVNLELKMAVLEINRNDIIWTICPMNPTWTRQERIQTCLNCHWDLYRHEQWMPQSPNWNGLPI